MFCGNFIFFPRWEEFLKIGEDLGKLLPKFHSTLFSETQCMMQANFVKKYSKNNKLNAAVYNILIKCRLNYCTTRSFMSITIKIFTATKANPCNVTDN